MTNLTLGDVWNNLFEIIGSFRLGVCLWVFNVEEIKSEQKRYVHENVVVNVLSYDALSYLAKKLKEAIK